VEPFYERAVSDIDRSMHRSLWAEVAHSLPIEESRTRLKIQHPTLPYPTLPYPSQLLPTLPLASFRMPQCMSICLSVYLSACQSVYLSACQSVYMSVNLSICLRVSLYICLYVIFSKQSHSVVLDKCCETEAMDTTKN